MDNKITAQWARETAQKQLGEQVNEQVNKCLKAIEDAVKRNEMSTDVGVYAKPLTITELQHRGFTVKQHDDQRDGSYLSISW